MKAIVAIKTLQEMPDWVGATKLNQNDAQGFPSIAAMNVCSCLLVSEYKVVGSPAGLRFELGGNSHVLTTPEAIEKFVNAQAANTPHGLKLLFIERERKPHIKNVE